MKLLLLLFSVFVVGCGAEKMTLNGVENSGEAKAESYKDFNARMDKRRRELTQKKLMLLKEKEQARRELTK